MLKTKRRLWNYSFINFTICILFILSSFSDFSSFFSLLLFGVYIIYLVFQKEEDIVLNQVIFLCMTNIIFDILWRKTSLAIPLEAKYLFDIASLILLFKIMINFYTYSQIIKDKIFWISIIFIIISFIIALIRNVSFINYILAIRIYLRCIPIYFVIAYKDSVFTKFYFLIFLLVNAVMIPIQSLISYYDDVSGVFGIRNVHVLLLLLIILAAILSTLYCNKEITLFKYILGCCLLFIVCGVGEIKIGLICIALVLICTTISNTYNIFKITVTTIILISLIIFGVNIIIRVSPEFKDFFQLEELKGNIIRYTMKSNNPEYTLGRLENIFYTHNFILDADDEKITGLGIGSAMPPDNYYFSLAKHSKNRESKDILYSDLYLEYGPYFGYHFSSMNIMYLETGWIGLLLYGGFIVINIKRAIKLHFKSNEISTKCLVNSSITLFLLIIPLMFYYNYIIDRGAILIIICVGALLKNRLNVGVDRR